MGSHSQQADNNRSVGRSSGATSDIPGHDIRVDMKTPEQTFESMAELRDELQTHVCYDGGKAKVKPFDLATGETDRFPVIHQAFKPLRMSFIVTTQLYGAIKSVDADTAVSGSHSTSAAKLPVEFEFAVIDLIADPTNAEGVPSFKKYLGSSEDGPVDSTEDEHWFIDPYNQFTNPSGEGTVPNEGRSGMPLTKVYRDGNGTLSLKGPRFSLGRGGAFLEETMEVDGKVPPNMGIYVDISATPSITLTPALLDLSGIQASWEELEAVADSQMSGAEQR